jgi:uncharacterized protein (DUF433 family)
MTFDRISTDPDVMGGLPSIRGLRIPVATVVTMVAEGMSGDEIIAELPDLTREDVPKLCSTLQRPSASVSSLSGIRREIPRR